MSRVMYQQDGDTDSLRFVFMGRDCTEAAVNGGCVLEGSHGPGSSSDLAEPSFDGVGGPDLLSLGKGVVAEAGEEID